MSPTGDRVYVTNFFSNDISVVDANPLSGTFQTVIATIPVGLNPAGIAAHPDGRTIYCVNHGDSTLSVVDTDSTSGSSYSAKASINTNSTSRSVDVTPDGGRIVIGTSYGLLLIQADDTSAKKSINTNSTSRSVDISPDGGLALVLTTDDFLLLIDIIEGSPTEGQAKASINTNSTSRSVDISPDGGFAYLTLLIGLLQTYEISQPGGDQALPGGTNSSGSPYTLTLVNSLDVGENPTGLAFDPSGSGKLLVVNSGDATVSVVQATAAIGIAEEPAAPPIPVTPRLYATMPNPFTRTTRIRYDLVEASPVNITIFDLQGRVIKVVEDALDRPAGSYETVWDGRNQNGQRVSSGVYFYRLKIPRYHQARKVVLLR